MTSTSNLCVKSTIYPRMPVIYQIEASFCRFEFLLAMARGGFPQPFFWEIVMTFSHKCRKPALILRLPERDEISVHNSASKIFLGLAPLRRFRPQTCSARAPVRALSGLAKAQPELSLVGGALFADTAHGGEQTLYPGCPALRDGPVNPAGTLSPRTSRHAGSHPGNR